MNSKQRDIKVNGIVIRKTEYKETSLILEIFTKELATISVIAKGIRKPKNTNFGLLEILNELEMDLYKNPNSDWYIFKSAIFLKSHPYKLDFKRIVLMQAAIEIYRQLIISEHDAEELYNLLTTFLNYIKTIEMNGIAIFWRFLLKLLKIIGIELNFTNCAICNEKVETIAYFPQKHGFICHKCYNPIFEESVFQLSEEEIDLFSKLNNIGNHLDGITISQSMTSQINRIFITHFSEHFHKPFYLKSLSMY